MKKFLSIIFLAMLSVLVAAQTAPAGPVAAAPVREISGQVRLAGRPAPAGVPVSLRVVFNRDLIEADQQESVRTVTDASGKFAFHHLENLGSNAGKELFLVSAIYDGFRGSQQLADLTENQRGEVLLDLQRLTSHPAVPRTAAPAGQSSVPNGSAGAAQDAAPSPSRVSRNPEAQEALDRAQELLFRKKDPGASIAEFKKAVKLDPWYGPGYVLMGLAYMQMQRWDSAQLAFDEATKVEPGNAQAFLGLGSAFNEQHDYAGAQKALEQSLRLKPESAEAHYELARTLCAQNKWQAAGPHAQKAIEINPDYAGPHALMGNIYLQDEDAVDALAEFRTYLRLEPDGSLAPQVKDIISQLERAVAEDGRKSR